MASSSSALLRGLRACVTCVRGGQRFARRYRDFLLDPGTLFTALSLVLLIAATIVTPDGLINSEHARSWLYLAAALAGPSTSGGQPSRVSVSATLRLIFLFRLPPPPPSSSVSILLLRSWRCSYCWVGCSKCLSPRERAMPWTHWQNCSLTG